MIKNEAHKKLFSDEAQLKLMKQQFVRHATEEILRRSFNSEKEAEKIVSNVQDYLFEGHDQFVEELFKKKEAQMTEAMDISNNDQNKK